jgi:hypothetical protein
LASLAANANTFLTRGVYGMFPIIFVSGGEPTCFSTFMRTISRSSPILLQHIDCYALSKFDQTEQQVFSSHVVVVEPLGLLARKRQDLLGAWSKIIHYCVSEAGRRLSFLKVDTTPALQHLLSKVKKIEYCDE